MATPAVEFGAELLGEGASDADELFAGEMVGDYRIVHLLGEGGDSLMFEIHDSVKDLAGSTPTRRLIVSRALK